MVVLLLLELQQLPQNCWGRRGCPALGGGRETMWYFSGALLELPPMGSDMILFLFFSSVASQAFMVPS
jgi:hypothetical protein